MGELLCKLNTDISGNLHSFLILYLDLKVSRACSLSSTNGPEIASEKLSIALCFHSGKMFIFRGCLLCLK